MSLPTIFHVLPNRSLHSHVNAKLHHIPAFALSIALFTTPASFAENVRVQDVESDIMRAGLEASSEHRLDAAERFFQTYLKQEDPNSASAYSNLGMTHLEMKKTSLAVEDFSKAIKLAPQAAVPLLNRAIAYEQLGVDAATAGHPDQARTFYTSALEDCKRAIENDPEEFAAYFNKGNVQLRLEDYSGALDSFKKAADLTQIAGYRLRAAVLEYQAGDSSRAQQQLRGLVRKYGRYAEAHAALAAMQWMDDKQSEAEEHLARATELEPIWSNERDVRNNTRWPPKLYDAYSKMLKIAS